MSHAAHETFTLTRENRLHECALHLVSMGLVATACVFLAVFPYMMFTGRMPVSPILFVLFFITLRTVPRSSRWIDASLLRTITQIDIDHARQCIRLSSSTGTRVIARFTDIRAIAHIPVNAQSPSESINISLHNGRTFTLNPTYFTGGAETLLTSLDRARTSPCLPAPACSQISMA